MAYKLNVNGRVTTVDVSPDTPLLWVIRDVLNLHGTLDYFIENTFNYPTLAEAYKIAALDAWNRMGTV